MNYTTSETCRVSCQNKFMKLVHLVRFIIKKFVTMHGHTNIKFMLTCSLLHELGIPLSLNATEVVVKHRLPCWLILPPLLVDFKVGLVLAYKLPCCKVSEFHQKFFKKSGKCWFKFIYALKTSMSYQLRHETCACLTPSCKEFIWISWKLASWFSCWY